MSGIRSTGVRAALFTAPLLLGLLATAAAPAGAVGSHTSHPGKSLTCRGKGVDPDALVRHRTEIVINAPLRTVWKLQTDVERWPSWQAVVETVERLDDGPFRKGSAFRWTTPIPPTPRLPPPAWISPRPSSRSSATRASAGPAPRQAKDCASRASMCGTSSRSRAAYV